MDKWKIVLIVLLLGGLGAYGFYQQNAASPLPDARVGEQMAPSLSPEAVALALAGATKGPWIGKPALAWSIPANLWMNAPQPISLQDVKGHVTILEFFRVECHHCEEAAPFMRDVYTKYQPQGLRMVTFQSPGEAKTESDWNHVQATVRRWNVPYPVAFDKEATLFRKRYKGNTYPTVIVLDENGVIRFYQTGHDALKAAALESFVAKALKK